MNAHPDAEEDDDPMTPNTEIDDLRAVDPLGIDPAMPTPSEPTRPPDRVRGART